MLTIDGGCPGLCWSILFSSVGKTKGVFDVCSKASYARLPDVFAISSVEEVRVPQIAILNHKDFVTVFSVVVDQSIRRHNQRVFIVHSWSYFPYDYLDLWVPLSQLGHKSSYVVENSCGIFCIQVVTSNRYQEVLELNVVYCFCDNVLHLA